MKVSIIVPIYNVEKYIERCAVSLFEQNFEDIEYIFVNDCTTDKSVEILEKIIEKYSNRKPFVKLIHHKKNRGLGATRKTGIESAVGKYILHIDSDDWCELNMVSLLYNKAEETDADIVACDYFISYTRKEIYKKQEYTGNIKQDVLNLWIGLLRPYTWNKLIKKTLYTKNNIYPTTKIVMPEDYWLTVRLFSIAKKIAYVPRALYHYWQENENSITHNFSEKSFKDIRCHITSTTEFLHQKGLYKKYKEAFNTKSLAYLIWVNNGKYDRKLINSICPEVNKLQYIWKQPNWDFHIKIEYSFSLLKMKIIWIFFRKVKNRLKRIVGLKK